MAGPRPVPTGWCTHADLLRLADVDVQLGGSSGQISTEIFPLLRRVSNNIRYKVDCRRTKVVVIPSTSSAPGWYFNRSTSVNFFLVIFFLLQILLQVFANKSQTYPNPPSLVPCLYKYVVGSKIFRIKYPIIGIKRKRHYSLSVGCWSLKLH